MSPPPASEFEFELLVCRWAEHEWPPAGERAEDRAVLVARQLGTKRRRWDTIVIEADREALRRRANFGAERLDGDLLHVVRSAPEEWAWYRDALPEPGYSWRYVREAIHEADDRGILDVRRDGNRIEIRRKWPYPDWIDRIVAIENKPDLDASAARTLRPQLERDVALGLADEAWVATTATGERIEPALLEDIPVEAGVLAVDPESKSAAVAWHPRTLDADAPGTRIGERAESDSEFVQSAATFEYAEPEQKRETRLRIAERAYERGWRSFVDTMRPDCRHFQLRDADGQLLPRCGAKECTPTSAECSGSCGEYEPEPPAWRQRGWPIEGGPGNRLRKLLAARRRRRRPGQ
ncbi:hypothetical protein SAMN06269185_1962 [Natronoarchaeum philippinense]|uniref:Uncharacterized protein n=1 Tax=Natronoarchaeum philippinense TaxID=558529 RepID=A0A285NTL5_NATPI|nr:DUF5787 family protein [Natronoarchaeum philippinense]SNZ12862.1 hypothetical protein SAMN06269185_1962 [Natronoarchaeum philippinense]